MTERIIEQAVEEIDDGNVIEAMDLINVLAETDDQAEELKEEVVRSALAERAFDELSIGDFIRSSRIQRIADQGKKIPRNDDDDINRDVIRSIVSSRYRRKLGRHGL